MLSRRLVLFASWLTLVAAWAPGARAAEPVDFKRDLLPMLKQRCVECHGKQKASGGLRLDRGAPLLEGGISGKSVTPGDGKGSYLVQRLRGEGGEDPMPLKADALSAAEIALVARWIDDGAQVPPEPTPQFVPAPAGLRRLTVSQYRSSLRDLLGGKVTLPNDIEPDTLISGSAAVGATRIPLSPRATEQFASAATRVAAEALADADFRRRWLSCAPSPGCLPTFVEKFGRRAWRRPLTRDEIARYTKVGQRMGRDLPRAVELVVSTLLQSPRFLYRVEIGTPDPRDPTRRVLTDFELASRLSFFLWGGPPDDGLLDATAIGALSTDEGLRTEAERMLASPRARQTLEAFFVELLRLRRLDRLPQFRTTFKQASNTLGKAMRTETLKVIEEVAFDPERDFREIFDTRATYVNGELAKLYGLPAPAADEAFVRIELPWDAQRAGVLGHASFLALNAHPTASSPTRRGKFIREVLLCQAVPPPPPNVSTKLPEDHDGDAPRTVRQKLDVHRTSPQCNGCHKAMDPMGLAFESFDGLGAYRTSENGLPIDTSGELDGVPFKNAAELGTLLRKSPKVGACLARNLFRFAMGHLEEEGEEPLMDELARSLETDGYRFGSLVLNVVKSRGFRYVAALDRARPHGILQGKELSP